MWSMGTWYDGTFGLGTEELFVLHVKRSNVGNVGGVITSLLFWALRKEFMFD